MHPADAKAELRASIEQRLKQMSEKERQAESRSLCRRLIEGTPRGAPVCAFVPLKSEPDITPFLEEVLRRGDLLYLPCFDGILTFRRATDLSVLIKGPLNILEPPSTAPLLALSNQQLATSDLVILVPGRAFDRAGNRLGRGNGGYDRWIADTRKANVPLRCIGAALECQIVAVVPVEPHDQKMDAVATARGIVKVK